MKISPIQSVSHSSLFLSLADRHIRTPQAKEDKPIPEPATAKEKLDYVLRHPSDHFAPPSIMQLRIEALLESSKDDEISGSNRTPLLPSE